MKRIFDICMAVIAAILLLPLILVVTVVVKLTSFGPALYWSNRIGRNGLVFSMPKFRSMKVGTPVVATHMLGEPSLSLTPVGGLIRKLSLDEVPQLWSIVKGDMSFVGPRPALYNQHDLIELRSKYGIDLITPGLTGWAQVNGRDELPITVKVSLDLEYLENMSAMFDLKIILLTFYKVFKKEGVTH